jgi:O-antigen/teichoic acid export membrane protein
VFLLIPFNRGILQGLQKFNSLGANLIIEGIARLLIALGLIFLGFKSNGAIAAVLIASAAALILTFPALNIKKFKGRLKVDRTEVYNFTVISFIALFLINAIYNIDIFLVKHFFSSEIAGQYAVISLLGKVILFGATSIGLVMFPKVSEAHLNDRKQVNQIFKKSLLFAFIISLLISAIYLLFPNLIINLLFGQSYLAIAPLIGFFGIAMLFLSLAYISVLYKLAIGKKRFIFNILSAVIAEIALICLFHSSLSQIVTILIAINAVLFISLLKQ